MFQAVQSRVDDQRSNASAGRGVEAHDSSLLGFAATAIETLQSLACLKKPTVTLGRD